MQRSALTRNSQSNLILSKTGGQQSSNSLTDNKNSLLKLKKSLNQGMKTAKKHPKKQSKERQSREESAFIETPKEAHKKWRQKIISPEKSAHIECYIERKRDREIKDDIYVMIKHLDADVNQLEELETPRLEDAVKINMKNLYEKYVTGRGN